MLWPVLISVDVPSDSTMLHPDLSAPREVAVEVDVAADVVALTVEDVEVAAEADVADLVTVEAEVVDVEVAVVEAPTEVASATSRARSRLSKSASACVRTACLSMLPHIF